jgi:hypothetical protein
MDIRIRPKNLGIEALIYGNIFLGLGLGYVAFAGFAGSLDQSVHLPRRLGVAAGIPAGVIAILLVVSGFSLSNKGRWARPLGLLLSWLSLACAVVILTFGLVWNWLENARNFPYFLISAQACLFYMGISLAILVPWRPERRPTWMPSLQQRTRGRIIHLGSYAFTLVFVYGSGAGVLLLMGLGQAALGLRGNFGDLRSSSEFQIALWGTAAFCIKAVTFLILSHGLTENKWWGPVFGRVMAGISLASGIVLAVVAVALLAFVRTDFYRLLALGLIVTALFDFSYPIATYFSLRDSKEPHDWSEP